MKWIFVSVGLLLAAAGIWLCGQNSSRQLFNQQKWATGRQQSPCLNFSPAMLDDLMANYLSLGMTLDQVTNLLGQPDIRTRTAGTTASIVRTRGEFLQETVYVYQPGTHRHWTVTGTQALVLHFVPDGQGLREWSPLSAVVRAPTAGESGVSGARSTEALPLGNLQIAGTTNQFQALLGPPDSQSTEYQLNYFLGKRSYFAWDQTFLELHFDTNKRLTRMVRTEH
jgi:hypothetical protein